MTFVFPVLLVLFYVGDILWWLRARRRIHQQPWRSLALGFIALQLVGISMILTSRFTSMAWDGYLPRLVVSMVFIWHVLIVIPWILIVSFVGLGKGVLALARWFTRVQHRYASNE